MMIYIYVVCTSDLLIYYLIVTTDIDSCINSWALHILFGVDWYENEWLYAFNNFDIIIYYNVTENPFFECSFIVVK